jgi:hypothetical protein
LYRRLGGPQEQYTGVEYLACTKIQSSTRPALSESRYATKLSRPHASPLIYIYSYGKISAELCEF